MFHVSLISNYGRSIAAIALHFGRVPHQVMVAEIYSYLYRMTVHEKQSRSPSRGLDKHTSTEIKTIEPNNISKQVDHGWCGLSMSSLNSHNSLTIARASYVIGICQYTISASAKKQSAHPDIIEVTQLVESEF